MAYLAPGSDSGQTATGSQPEIEEARQLIQQGYDLLENTGSSRPAQALEYCDQALPLFKRARELVGADPDLGRTARLAIADCYSQRGHQQRYAGQYAESLADLSQSLRLNPANAEDYYYRGLSYLAKGDEKLARTDLTEYLKRGVIDYLRHRARSRLAELSPGQDDAKAALSHWNSIGVRLNAEATELMQPRDEAEPQWAGAAALFNKALENFNKSLDISKGDMMTRLSMRTALQDQAECYLNMNEYDLALENYTRLLEIFPEPRYIFLRGETLLQAGHTNLAHTAFEEFLAKGTDPEMRTQARLYLRRFQAE